MTSAQRHPCRLCLFSMVAVVIDIAHGCSEAESVAKQTVLNFVPDYFLTPVQMFSCSHDDVDDDDEKASPFFSMFLI